MICFYNFLYFKKKDMIKIGIELNGIVRDINRQYLKYYVKDIKQDFDDTNVNLNVTNLIDELEFESKTLKEQFIYEDYPYELFGCAAPMSRNLHTFINGWIHDLYWDENVEVSFFSLGEDELTIQSSYFYLSKSGSRVRKVIFPNNNEEVLNEFDVIITINKDLLDTQRKNKIMILIKKDDNKQYELKTDYVYDNLEDLINDREFIDKIKKQLKKINKHESIFGKINKYIKEKIYGNTKL